MEAKHKLCDLFLWWKLKFARQQLGAANKELSPWFRCLCCVKLKGIFINPLHIKLISWIVLCAARLIRFSPGVSLQFVASEHKKNGVSNAEPKDVVIEPDGPSTISKDEDDSKVVSTNELMHLRSWRLNWQFSVVHVARRMQRRRGENRHEHEGGRHAGELQGAPT